MMGSKIKLPAIKPGISKDGLNNIEVKIRDSFKSAGNDRYLQVIKSTSKNFNGLRRCVCGAIKMTMNIKSMNSTY
jgi:hypothetical protein